MIVEKVEKRSFKPRGAGIILPCLPACGRQAAFLTLFDPNDL